MTRRVSPAKGKVVKPVSTTRGRFRMVRIGSCPLCGQAIIKRARITPLSPQAARRKEKKRGK